MDLGALAMPLEAGRGAGLGSPARVSLEDERSERRRARALLSWVVARPRPRAGEMRGTMIDERPRERGMCVSKMAAGGLRWPYPDFSPLPRTKHSLPTLKQGTEKCALPVAGAWLPAHEGIALRARS